MMVMLEEGDEADASLLSAKLLLTEFVASRRRILDHGLQIRKTYSQVQLEILEETHVDTQLDELNLAFAVAKMSERGIESWVRNVDLIEALIEEEVHKVLDLQDVQIVELFVMLLAELKPKSRKHMLHFLQAATDNEWADALFIAKGNESEFRWIDRASDETRKEFGLGPRN